MDLSIVIVNFRTGPLLEQCLRSIYALQEGIDYEVIVVENGSEDGSEEGLTASFPELHVIANTKNKGYAKANNQALSHCEGEFILLLNPDTVVPPGVLPELISFLRENQKVGAVGCRLIMPDGEMDQACRRSFPNPLSSLCKFFRLERVFPNSRFFSRYNLTYLDPAGVYEVDSLVGAFLMVRKQVVDEVGGLDERFFLYGEDLDWCFRMREANWDIIYRGDCEVTHYKGASSRQNLFGKYYHFHWAMMHFYRKHLARKYPFLMNGLIYSAIWVRFAGCAAYIQVQKLLSPARFREKTLVPEPFPQEKDVHALQATASEKTGENPSP